MTMVVQETLSDSAHTASSVLQKYHTTAPAEVVVRRSLYLGIVPFPEEIKRLWSLLVHKFQIFSPSEKTLIRINLLIFKYVKEKHPTCTTPDEVLWSHQGIQLRLPIPIQKEVVPEITGGPFVIRDQEVVCEKKEEGYLINGKDPLAIGKSLVEGDIVCYKNNRNTFETRFTVGKQGSIMVISEERPVLSPAAFKQTREHLKKLFFLKEAPIKTATFSEPFEEGAIFRPYFSSHSTQGEIEEGLKEALNTGQQIIINLKKDKVLASVVSYFKVEFDEMKYSDVQKAMRLFQFVYFAFKEPIHDFEYEVSNQTYYLGEFLRFGYGKCLHVALLFKVLADNLGLKANMQAGHIPKAHAWNVVDIQGTYYFADAAKGGFFLIR